MAEPFIYITHWSSANGWCVFPVEKALVRGFASRCPYGTNDQKAHTGLISRFVGENNSMALELEPALSRKSQRRSLTSSKAVRWTRATLIWPSHDSTSLTPLLPLYGDPKRKIKPRLPRGANAPISPMASRSRWISFLPIDPEGFTYFSSAVLWKHSGPSCEGRKSGVKRFLWPATCNYSMRKVSERRTIRPGCGQRRIPRSMLMDEAFRHRSIVHTSGLAGGVYIMNLVN